MKSRFRLPNSAVVTEKPPDRRVAFHTLRRNTYMNKIQNDVKAIVKALGAIAKKMENIAKQMNNHPPVKAAKKAVAKKSTARKTVVKKTVAKKAAPTKQTGVIDAVYKVVKSSRKGVTVAQIKAKTGLSSKQVSNVCYKLTKKGTIVAKSRGLYVAK